MTAEEVNTYSGCIQWPCVKYDYIEVATCEDLEGNAQRASPVPVLHQETGDYSHPMDVTGYPCKASATV